MACSERIRMVPWLERQFPAALPPTMFPTLLERLRGTPARIEDRLLGLEDARLARRHGDAWSVLENLGHLTFVEALWAGRLDDLEASAAEMRAARFEAWLVRAAGFDERPAGHLCSAFRAKREALVARLASLDRDVLSHAAWHPRLRQPMGVVDLMYMAAEHDDHHLARISELLALRHEAISLPPDNPAAVGSV